MGLAFGGDATSPLFEGRRGVFWWPPKIGGLFGDSWRRKSDTFPNMIVLWGLGVGLEIVEDALGPFLSLQPNNHVL
jgi:hypothetical protein